MEIARKEAVQATDDFDSDLALEGKTKEKNYVKLKLQRNKWENLMSLKKSEFTNNRIKNRKYKSKI